MAGCASLKMEDIAGIFSGGSPSNGSLSTGEVVAGLKEALRVGAESASDRSSQRDGFFKNPALFIPLPAELKRVENTLKQVGMGALVQQFVESLNRGAEKAAGLAKPIFFKAITSMSIADAWSILNGQNATAATEYLRRTTGEELTQTFLPVIRNSLEQVNATRYWSEISGRYNAVPFVKPVRADLDGYVTERAMNGLFLLISDEEKKIRQNPMDYASAIIRKVFSKQ
jgi:hypothetical protein